MRFNLEVKNQCMQYNKCVEVCLKKKKQVCELVGKKRDEWLSDETWSIVRTCIIIINKCLLTRSSIPRLLKQWTTVDLSLLLFRYKRKPNVGSIVLHSLYYLWTFEEISSTWRWLLLLLCCVLWLMPGETHSWFASFLA